MARLLLSFTPSRARREATQSRVHRYTQASTASNPIRLHHDRRPAKPPRRPPAAAACDCCPHDTGPSGTATAKHQTFPSLTVSHEGRPGVRTEVHPDRPGLDATLPPTPPGRRARAAAARPLPKRRGSAHAHLPSSAGVRRSVQTGQTRAYLRTHTRQPAPRETDSRSAYHSCAHSADNQQQRAQPSAHTPRRRRHRDREGG